MRGSTRSGVAPADAVDVCSKGSVFCDPSSEDNEFERWMECVGELGGGRVVRGAGEHRPDDTGEDE